MFLLFNIMSRFVIAFLPWSKCLLVSWLQSPSTVIIEPKKRKSVTASIFYPSFRHEVMVLLDTMIFFLIFSFKQSLSLSFTLIKRLFSSSLLSAIRVLSSNRKLSYLRLLMVLLPVLIPACNSSSPAFLIMCSTYRLNRQGDRRQTCCTPFSILNQSSIPSIQGSNCCFLTCIQISQESGKMVWYTHLFKRFPEYYDPHSQSLWCSWWKRCRCVSLEFPSFLYDPANVVILVFSSSSFSKPSLDIWKFLVHMMLKPSMQNFKHDLTSMGDECNCLMVSTFFNTTLFGNWDEDWSFPVLWPQLGLPDLLKNWKKASWWHLALGFWIALLESSHPLALLTAVLPKAHLTCSPERLALGGWSHHCSNPVHLDLLCTVLPCILSISSRSLQCLLCLHSLWPLLCPSLGRIFPWYLWFSQSDL